MTGASATPPFRVERLDHLVLRAQDLESLTAFYRDVLGCAVERELEELGLVQLRAGASLIDLVSTSGELGRDARAHPEGRNLDHLCLRIEPFEPVRLRAHLQRFGVDHGGVKTVYGAEGFGPSIYIEDPEGNTIELKGPASEQPDSDG